MTLLPPLTNMAQPKGEIISEELIGETAYMHNWLYSVVPVSEQQNDTRINAYNGYEYYISVYPLGAYLTGYCRNCRKAFSQAIPCRASGEYVETQLQIPVYGCVGPTT